MLLKVQNINWLQKEYVIRYLKKKTWLEKEFVIRDFEYYLIREKSLLISN